MIVNGSALLEAAPIKNMFRTKERNFGLSYGLSEAGYDIRLKQSIEFTTRQYPSGTRRVVYTDGLWTDEGNFVLASAMEKFQMPENLVGIVHDKSTWARHGLSVFNTVIEPGFKGGLTLELVYHGNGDLCIPAGAGIAQVIFHQTAVNAAYSGKYQFQGSDPVPPILA